jgi:hypothetical protein
MAKVIELFPACNLFVIKVKKVTYFMIGGQDKRWFFNIETSIYFLEQQIKIVRNRGEVSIKITGSPTGYFRAIESGWLTTPPAIRKENPMKTQPSLP